MNMSHKSLIGGTAYGVTGGKPLIGGTTYSISNGRTLIGNTGYDISFLPVTVYLWDDDNNGALVNTYEFGKRTYGKNNQTNVTTDTYENNISPPPVAANYIDSMAYIGYSEKAVWLASYYTSTTFNGQVVLSYMTYAGYVMLNVPNLGVYNTVHIQMRNEIYNTWKLDVQILSDYATNSTILQSTTVGPVQYTDAEYTADISSITSASGLRLVANTANVNLNNYPRLIISKIWLTKD